MTKEKNSTIWISYDLGVRGDYEGLYRWLDGKSAKECGPNLAVFKYKYTSDMPERIKDDLKSSINIDKRNRIYLIYRNRDGSDSNKGVFLFGSRKGPRWAGFAPLETVDVDEGE